MTNPQTNPAVTVEKLSVHRGKRLVLDDISLAIPAGTIFALMGPNGAGKSTLLQTIAGLIAPSTGTIRIGDTGLHALNARDQARARAFVPQRSELNAALSVDAVVAQGRYAYGRGLGHLTPNDQHAVENALDTMGITHLRTRAFSALSQGERRRVLLARALSAQTPLLLLDEPTAASDIGHALKLFKLLKTLAASGTTIIIVLHHLDDARRFCDHAALLNGGIVVAQGSAESVITPRHIRQVYGVDLVPQGALGFRLPEETP